MTDMQLSAKGYAEIAGSEGIIPMPYKDSVGVWTFGIGHTNHDGGLDPKKMIAGKNYGIDMVIGLYIKDMQRYVDRVNRAVKVKLEQHEFDALVSFDYNTGGIYRARLTQLLNEGAPRKQVANAFMNWLRPIEIKSRRAGERDLFYVGTYKHKGMATLQLANKKGNKIRKGIKTVNAAKLIAKYLAEKDVINTHKNTPLPVEKNAPEREVSIPKDKRKSIMDRIFDFFNSGS